MTKARQIELLSFIFETLDGYFGSRWNTGEQSICDAGGAFTTFARAWLDCLADCTKQDVQRALCRLKRDKPRWPPGALEFSDLCLPTTEEMNLPDVGDAYRMACLGDWTHAIVWHAARKVGTWELRNEPEKKTRTRFETAYHDLLMKARRGEQFEQPEGLNPALSHEAPVPAGYEEDHNAIAAGTSPLDLAREKLKRARTLETRDMEEQQRIRLEQMKARLVEQQALIDEAPHIPLPGEDDKIAAETVQDAQRNENAA